MGASVLMGTILVSAPSLAQTTQPPKGAIIVAPPTPSKEDTTRPLIMSYLLMVGLIAAVIGANLMPTKRTHQD